MVNCPRKSFRFRAFFVHQDRVDAASVEVARLERFFRVACQLSIPRIQGASPSVCRQGLFQGAELESEGKSAFVGANLLFATSSLKLTTGKWELTFLRML